MEVVAEQKTASANRKTANYLVSGYNDLRDVVLTIEKMIMETSEVRQKNLLRQGCEISIRPLADRNAYIVRIKLHPDIKV
jgi:hypothetical protein